jgi:hypothetical protein
VYVEQQLEEEDSCGGGDSSVSDFVNKQSVVSLSTVSIGGLVVSARLVYWNDESHYYCNNSYVNANCDGDGCWFVHVEMAVAVAVAVAVVAIASSDADDSADSSE